jgi:hypothetical protein
MNVIRPKRVVSIVSLLVAMAVAGCTIQAKFYSKTGRTYPQVAHRAVICDVEEGKKIVASGGQIIGTIDAQSMTVDNSVQNVNIKAAEVAAEAGGTHVVIARAERDEYERHNPATETRECVRTENGRACQTTYEDASTTTFSKAAGEYVVVRLEPQQWGYLPPELQPMP